MLNMFHIRTTKTSSGATAVQVIQYEQRRKIIVLHIGSAHTSQELLKLKQTASAWIEKTTKRQRLFPSVTKSSDYLLPLDKCKYLGCRYLFIYEVLNQLFTVFKFHLLNNSLLVDLVLIRIIEPASKLYSIKLIKDYFGIKRQRREWYRQLPKFSDYKKAVEAKVLAIAKKHFNFNLSLVFYDVTTLYFESFREDEFRKRGFSKDNKAQQPQILIGLVVNTDGFPIAYEIFEGNTFEGHTLIPVISAFQCKHKIKKLTIVADAAMLSLNNLQSLQQAKLYYVVGARMGNLPCGLIKNISIQLNQVNDATLRFKTKHGDLICSFSALRYRKDKHEMKKQILKAEFALQNPSQVKRLKFLRNRGKTGYQINTALIEKTEALLGIKGYYTNLSSKIDNQIVIRHYHNLWQVEQAFRIAKSDLAIRPIYHFKEHTIRAHILMCFMALAVSKFMEIKTGKSIKSIVTILKSITDARILNTLNQQEIMLRSEITDEIKQVLHQLDLWY